MTSSKCLHAWTRTSCGTMLSLAQDMRCHTLDFCLWIFEALTQNIPGQWLLHIPASQQTTCGCVLALSAITWFAVFGALDVSRVSLRAFPTRVLCRDRALFSWIFCHCPCSSCVTGPDFPHPHASFGHVILKLQLHLNKPIYRKLHHNKPICSVSYFSLSLYCKLNILLSGKCSQYTQEAGTGSLS